MGTFASRLSAAASDSRLILACDYGGGAAGGARTVSVARVVRDIRNIAPHICAIKLNYHLLLPLGMEQVSRITDAAHKHGLQAIADIKLNDIGNTNLVASEILWDAGFDALIANPIMGPLGLAGLVRSAHQRGKGIVTLCHMSAPEARASYEMRSYATARSRKPRRIHEIFLDWALDSGADGIIAGATFPDIIRECRATIDRKGKGARGRHRPLIISPGVGAQGADAADTMQAGSDYVIAGRSIIRSEDPARAAMSLGRDIAAGIVR